MKCLVTGAAGFIGSNLIERLLCKDSQVWAVDDFSTSSKGNISHLLNNPRLHFRQGSVLDADLLKELIRECEVIYHLAAAVGVKYIMENLIKSIKINIEGTENILEIASKSKKKTLIASSSEIYGKSENYPFSEKSDRILGPPTKLRWSYSSSKAIDEFLALAYHTEKGLPVVITRLFNVSGPRQVGEYGMVIPRFVQQALKNEPLTVYGDGKQLRSFIHIEDAVCGLVSLMENDNADGEVFNLGSPEPVSITQLAQRVIELSASKSKIVYIPYEQVFGSNFEDLKYRVPDISKISRAVGFKPKKNLEDIIRDVIEYYKNRPQTTDQRL